MADDIQNGWGAQALDVESLARRAQSVVLSGCAVTDGSGALEIDVASGTVVVAGTEHSVGATTVTQSAGNSNPRKDVVYVDSNGAVQVAEGRPLAARPAGQTGRDTYVPRPPDLSGMDACPLAEVWVAAGASDTGSGDITDRRHLADWVFGDTTHQSVTADKIVIGGTLYEEDDNSPHSVAGVSSTTYTVANTFREVVILQSPNSGAGFNKLQVNGDSGANYDTVTNADTRTSGATEWSIPYGSWRQRLVIRTPNSGNRMKFGAVLADAQTGTGIAGDNGNIGGTIDQFTLFDGGGATRTTKFRVYGRDI